LLKTKTKLFFKVAECCDVIEILMLAKVTELKHFNKQLKKHLRRLLYAVGNIRNFLGLIDSRTH
jgi:hypothetical protein